MDMTSPDAPNNCRNNSTVLKFSLSTAYHFSLASCTQLILGCAKVCWCPLVNFLGLFEAGFEKLKMVRWWAKNNDLCQWCHLEFQLELVLASASDGRTCAPSPNEVPLEQGCLVLQPSWGAGGAGGLGLRWNCCHCAVTPPLAASHHPRPAILCCRIHRPHSIMECPSEKGNIWDSGPKFRWGGVKPQFQTESFVLRLQRTPSASPAILCCRIHRPP